MKMLQCEFKPTAKSRAWHKSFKMHPEARANMEKHCALLKEQENWHDWRIITVEV